MPGLLIDVCHVAALGGAYRGDGSWAAWLASWQTSWPWLARPWSWRTSYAVPGLMQRRTGRVGLVKVSPKVNRGRRQYLNRARKAAQRQARDRRRAALGERPA